MTRIAAFGDPFFYGSLVGDQGKSPYQLDALLTDAEVLKFIILGYGTDQAILRYLKLGKQHTLHSSQRIYVRQFVKECEHLSKIHFYLCVGAEGAAWSISQAAEDAFSCGDRKQAKVCTEGVTALPGSGFQLAE